MDALHNLDNDSVLVTATADDGSYLQVRWDRHGEGDICDERPKCEDETWDALTDSLFEAIKAEFWPTDTSQLSRSHCIKLLGNINYDLTDADDASLDDLRAIVADAIRIGDLAHARA